MTEQNDTPAGKRMVPLDDVLALFRGDSAIAYGKHAGWYPDDVIRVAYGRKPHHESLARLRDRRRHQ